MKLDMKVFGIKSMAYIYSETAREKINYLENKQISRCCLETLLKHFAIEISNPELYVFRVC